MAKKTPCIIPKPASIAAIQKVALKEPDHQRGEITDYVEWQLNKGAATQYKVVHLERMKSEVVFGTEYVAWDVHTDEPGRWWVITRPTNLYSQHEFPSLDYTLSFHVGVMARVGARDAKRAPPSRKDRLRSTWRRWETATDALDLAREAEDFQAVGMRCRETLVSLAKALQNDVKLLSSFRTVRRYQRQRTSQVGSLISHSTLRAAPETSMCEAISRRPLRKHGSSSIG